MFERWGLDEAGNLILNIALRFIGPAYLAAGPFLIGSCRYAYSFVTPKRVGLPVDADIKKRGRVVACAGKTVI